MCPPSMTQLAVAPRSVLRTTQSGHSKQTLYWLLVDGTSTLFQQLIQEALPAQQTERFIYPTICWLSPKASATVYFMLQCPVPFPQSTWGMHFSVRNGRKCLICAEASMRIPQKTGDTPAHPRSGKCLSAQS